MFNSIKTNFLEILVSILEGSKEFRVIVSLFSYILLIRQIYIQTFHCWFGYIGI